MTKKKPQKLHVSVQGRLLNVLANTAAKEIEFVGRNRIHAASSTVSSTRSIFRSVQTCCHDDCYMSHQTKSELRVELRLRVKPEVGLDDDDRCLLGMRFGPLPLYPNARLSGSFSSWLVREIYSGGQWYARVSGCSLRQTQG